MLANVCVLCGCISNWFATFSYRGEGYHPLLTNLKTLLVVAWALAYGDEAEAALFFFPDFSLPISAVSWRERWKVYSLQSCRRCSFKNIFLMLSSGSVA